MEIRSDSFLCKEKLQSLQKEATDKQFIAGFNRGFNRGFYEACFVKNKEIKDLEREIGKLKEMLIERSK